MFMGSKPLPCNEEVINNGRKVGGYQDAKILDTLSVDGVGNR